MRSSRARAFATAALLALFTGSHIEPVVGVLRDGQVHHNSVTMAVLHQHGAPSGERGCQDGAAGPQQSPRGPQHEHGTATDHCTHPHSVGIPMLVQLSVPLFRAARSGPERGGVLASVALGVLIPPPKA
jgi:hypothetical protein